MPELNGIEVTPALCGMIDKVPQETFMRYWEECVLQILKAEKDIIYQSAFKAIKLARENQSNMVKGFKIFNVVFLDDFWKSEYFKIVEFHSDENLVKNKEVFLEAAFNQYWSISFNSHYWIKCLELNQDISYEKAIDDWKTNNQAIIVTYMNNLNNWNSRRQSIAV
ncbi:hypothetical protein [Nostoc sp. CALU 1950]|uniref:hypothetical protein n=1 Tax=Nostoc sp. CALU 1950 TaxID=3104321 RepID=UPI003EBC030B